MSTHHLVKNAQKGNFEAAVQVFLNYKEGAPDFEKSEELALNAFEKAVSILQSEFFLNELTISNFKKILDLKINLHQNLTVFIGENGVGKTSLLEAIRKNVMWIAATTRKDNTNGGTIDIKEEVNSFRKNKGAYIDCEFQIGKNYKCKGRVATPPDGIISDLKSELTKYRELGRNFRILNTYQNIDLPLFALYGIDRIQVTGKKSKSSDFGKIEGYDSSLSLNDKTSFDTLIIWLVQQLKLAKEGNTYLQDKNIKNIKAKKAIQNVEILFKKVYPQLKEIKLIYEDDGKDKVVIELENEQIYLHQFSDGQRVLFGLIGDIARRLLLLNDASETPLGGIGIVLIDEIELHLHPSWQQKIILILRESFPNIQFIVTTHSPHVLTTVEAECIRSIYIDHENKFTYEIPKFTKGAESNVVLEDVFYVDPRPQDVDEVKWLDQYIKLVNNDEWDSEEAKKLRTRLDIWGKNKETELDKIDIEISLRAFKRSKK